MGDLTQTICERINIYYRHLRQNRAKMAKNDTFLPPGTPWWRERDENRGILWADPNFGGGGGGFITLFHISNHMGCSQKRPIFRHFVYSAPWKNQSLRNSFLIPPFTINTQYVL